MGHSNFYLFVPLNKYADGNRIETDADVKQAVTYWLQTLDTNVFCAGI
jgi:hypothetical protein